MLQSDGVAEFVRYSQEERFQVARLRGVVLAQPHQRTGGGEELPVGSGDEIAGFCNAALGENTRRQVVKDHIDARRCLRGGSRFESSECQPQVGTVNIVPNFGCRSDLADHRCKTIAWRKLVRPKV